MGQLVKRASQPTSSITAFVPMIVGMSSIEPRPPGSIVPQESVGVGVQLARGGGKTKPATSAVEPRSGAIVLFHGPGSKKLGELFAPVRCTNADRKILMWYTPLFPLMGISSRTCGT